MNNITIIFERLVDDKFKIDLTSDVITFEFKPQTHEIKERDTLTLTLDVPEEMHEILEAKLLSAI